MDQRKVTSATSDERKRLLCYLRSEGEIVGNVGYPPLGSFAVVARRILPDWAATPARRLATDLLRPVTRRSIAKVKRRSPLRLHLACGRFNKDGWVNIDLVGSAADVKWNLARGIPFPAGSVDVVFHEHLLEHLPLSEGLALIAECFRVLRRGGALRIGVPDVDAYIRSYLGESGFIESVRPDRPTRLLAIQEVFYMHGHKAMYDLETLDLICRSVGFGPAVRCEFGRGVVVPNPDSEHRRRETLYVETTKT